MTDPVIIERAELDQMVRNAAELTANMLIDSLGLKARPLKLFVSEHYAVKVMKVNLARLNSAADRKIVERKLIQDKQTHNRFYRRSDVQKLLNDPTL